jgi:hypothetical protein
MKEQINGGILLVIVLIKIFLFTHFLEQNFLLMKEETQGLLFFFFLFNIFNLIIRLYYIQRWGTQPTDNLLSYAHLTDIYINTNTDESSFNKDKLYCGCLHFPCLTIPYGYGRIDDDVLYMYY